MHKNVIAQIRKATRKKYSAEEKIRIVLEGLRGEIPISELCRRERIAPTMYYRWYKAFLDAGKNGLTRETLRDAKTEEVRGLKPGVEASDLPGRGCVQRGGGAGVRGDGNGSGSCTRPREASVGQRGGTDLEALWGVPRGPGTGAYPVVPVPFPDDGEDRAVSPLVQGAGEPVRVGDAGGVGAGGQPVHRLLQRAPVS